MNETPPDQISARRPYAVFENWALALASSGFGIWVAYTTQDWTVFWLFQGGAVLILAAFYTEPWLDKNGRALTEFLANFGLMPRPTEAYMYVISLSLVFLLLFGDIWNDMAWALLQDEKGNMIWIYLYTFLGACYSIYFAFSQRGKTDFEIMVLKYYTAVFAAALAIATAIYAYQTKVDGYYILTIWNGFQAIVLLALSGRDIPGEYITLPSREARRIELIAGTVVVVVVLAVQKIIFGMYWATALSSVLIAWAIAENIFRNFPVLLENSPVMGQKVDPARMVRIKELETTARNGFLYLFFMGVLAYLGYNIFALGGALMGAVIGYSLVRWLHEG